MIGVADFHTAKGATFPGFDIGASVSAIKPSDANHISHEDYLYTGFLTAETKLPVLGITVMARGTDMNGFKSLGGGLKYSFKLLEVIDVSTMAFTTAAPPIGTNRTIIPPPPRPRSPFCSSLRTRASAMTTPKWKPKTCLTACLPMTTPCAIR